MQISGKFLPASSGPQNQGLSENRQPLPDRKLDSEQKNRQHTVEYVFQGEVLEDVVYQEQHRKPYTQAIDPANQTAISSYADASSTVQRQGRLVDIFI